MSFLKSIASPERPKKLFLILVSVSLMWTIFWILGQWPGLWDYDGLHDLNIAAEGWFSTWRSPLYSAYLQLLLFFASPEYLLPLQGLIWAVWLSVIFYLLWYRSKSPWILLLFLLLLFNPLFSLYSIYSRRETVQLMLTPTLLILMGVALTRPVVKDVRRFTLLVFISILGALMAGIRVENQYVWLLFLGVMSWGLRSQRRPQILFLGTSILFFLIVQLVFPFLVKIRSPLMLPGVLPGPGLRYEITGFLNPLTYFLVRDYNSPDKEEDFRILSEVFDTDLLIKHQQDFEIGPFHNGATRANFTKESFERLRERYWLLVRMNPALFLENRVKMYGKLAGYKTHYINSYAHPPEYNGASLEPNPVLSWAHGIQRKFFSFVANDRVLPGKYMKWLFASHFLSLLLTGYLIFKWKSYPATVMASALIWCRVLLVFLTTPGAAYYYLIEFQIWFYFALALMILEHNQNNRNTVASPG